jgi:hypothetical protein
VEACFSLLSNPTVCHQKSSSSTPQQSSFTVFLFHFCPQLKTQWPGAQCSQLVVVWPMEVFHLVLAFHLCNEMPQAMSL